MKTINATNAKKPRAIKGANPKNVNISMGIRTKRTSRARAIHTKKSDSKDSTLSLKTLQIAEIFSSIESKKEFAKLGMSASLLICVGSAFFKGNFARNLHIASGVALVGFSIWHHSLYE